MQKAFVTSQMMCQTGHRVQIQSRRTSQNHRSVRVAAADNDAQAAQLKAMQEAMKNPEVASRMQQLEEQMKNPQVQQQMNEMASVMSNPAFMSKMAELREDPELKPVFDEIRTGGMAAMMKWMNDPTFLSKIGEKMGDVVPQAAPPPPPEVNNILDAARYGDLEAIEDFCAISKQNDRDGEGRGALHYAVAYNRFDALKALLANGVDVDATDGKGNTALHYAAGYARTDCIQALVGAGASIAAANEGGQKPVDVVTEEPRNPLNQDNDILAVLRG